MASRCVCNLDVLPEPAEGDIRDKLALREGGVTEVSVECGRIDVLTPTEVIEVKRVKGWKGAIGQVMVYGRVFPSRTKRIHLYGNGALETYVLAQKHASELGIRVTVEEDFLDNVAPKPCQGCAGAAEVEMKIPRTVADHDLVSKFLGEVASGEARVPIADGQNVTNTLLRSWLRHWGKFDVKSDDMIGSKRLGQTLKKILGPRKTARSIGGSKAYVMDFGRIRRHMAKESSRDGQ